MSWSVGIDVGGTFTDLVAVGDHGAVVARKVLSTPNEQSVAVIDALREAAIPAERIERVVHGTTLVTNLLLERRGTRTILCATKGATDLLELRRQDRAALYDLAAHHPAPLVTADDVIAVSERIAPEGVCEALTSDEADRVAAKVAERGARTVAVSLLHAYSDARHEEQLARAIAARIPGVDVVCSSQVLPEIREYERTATTACEAYARPAVGAYLERLGERLARDGIRSLGIVASNGGMFDATHAARSAASLALSGPAGGVAGAALVARLAGFAEQSALSIDIGGTSADVGLIVNGAPLVESGGEVAGVPIALPRVLVETVSAGGGSLGWIDDGGALRVGPRSAGAVPGPVAFGRGGSQATVTDAHIALGNISARRMSGAVQLDANAAREAVAVLARELGADVERTALAMIATADAAMARALRRVSVERGIDPRDCVLIAFGGGGPLHACGLAEALGMNRILVPPLAGVLSALGLAVAPPRRVAYASVMRDLSVLDAGALSELTQGLERRTAQEQGNWEPEYILRMRYRGQGHELEIRFQPNDSVAALSARFGAAHQARYGFVLDVPVQAVSARCARSGTAPTVRLERKGKPSWNDAERLDDGSPCAAVVRGRAVIALGDATLLVADGWVARALPIGGWMVERLT
ncbi:MAG TPA: hydantoinase/oxoprolinase family protein [Gemmatimonadaceae bacterium]|nr:hydantoinase/oxoprolinase family protein [Gemmatimonadaceae bacterium]